MIKFQQYLLLQVTFIMNNSKIKKTFPEKKERHFVLFSITEKIPCYMHKNNILTEIITAA